jgi:DDE family transposase
MLIYHIWLLMRDPTPATTQDMEMTGVIHQGLEDKQLLPKTHFTDTG